MIISNNVGNYPVRATTATSSSASAGQQRSALEDKAAEATSSAPAQYDFSNMTNSQLLDAGKALAKEGKISLDEMFQIQLASSSFNGTQSDTTPKDFTKYFREQLNGEISRGGLSDSKSMVGTYSHLLSVMTNRISYTA